MAKYIPLDALVAEIKRRISLFKKEKKTEKWSAEASQMNVVSLGARIAMLEEILSIIDTLEVKEVDLDKEIDLVEDKYYGFESLSRADIIDIAKHFFELGLKAQHSSIGIPNIDDIFEEEGIDPNLKDAKIFKEFYYMALEKLKAQKGEEV